MYTVEVNVGRLLEGRIFALATLEEAHKYCEDALDHTKRARSPLVMVADHRRVAIYSQAVADELATVFGKLNDRLERVAILVSRTNATLSLQLERIVREARNPMRRVFYDMDPALEHVTPTLSKVELERARTFLREPLG